MSALFAMESTFRGPLAPGYFEIISLANPIFQIGRRLPTMGWPVRVRYWNRMADKRRRLLESTPHAPREVGAATDLTRSVRSTTVIDLPVLTFLKEHDHDYAA
jgi:hypothetical protein